MAPCSQEVNTVTSLNKEGKGSNSKYFFHNKEVGFEPVTCCFAKIKFKHTCEP